MKLPDIIVLFGGGLDPKTQGLNQLSLMRLNRLLNHLHALKSSSVNLTDLPSVITCGSKDNLHTGISFKTPPSDIFADLILNEPSLNYPSEKVISTQSGFCTITEALGAKPTIKRTQLKRKRPVVIEYETSEEHNKRVSEILTWVLGEGFLLDCSGYTESDGCFMNKKREELLLRLFHDNFDKFSPGAYSYYASPHCQDNF